jgi:hypothetical protein
MCDINARNRQNHHSVHFLIRGKSVDNIRYNP